MPTQVLLSHKRPLILQRHRRLPLCNNSKVRSVIPAPTAKRLKTGRALKMVKIAAKNARALILEDIFRG